MDPSPVQAADTNPTPHNSDTTGHSEERKPREDKKSPKTWLFVYLCNYPLLSASPSRHKNPDQRQYCPGAASREREREEARENWEWQKLETERLIKAEYVSHGREHYWCDFRLLSSQFPPQFRNVMSWLCWSVFVFVVIVWPPSALLYWLWRLGTGPRPAPLAAHCSQFSSFQQTRLTRLFLWE